MDRGDSDDGGGSRCDLEQQADWASPPDSEDSSFCLSPLCPLPYDDEHPNKYVPWELKAYPPEITEAWTKLYNAIALRNSTDLTSSLEKLSTEVLDQPNDDRETLLYMAASRGLSHVVELLLKAGANPSKRETYYTDRSPLMIAVEQCHVACVVKLLEVVDVNEKNGKGFTALFSAAQCGIGRRNMQQLDPLKWKEKWRIIQPRNKIILEMLLDKGIIDCTHVTLRGCHLLEAEHHYVNRKKQHSINVQLVCTSDYKISNVVARWPGGAHDSRILRNSRLARGFTSGILQGVLLGDSGYPQLPWLMTPYLDTQGIPARESYNRAHKKTRVKIEQLNGQLKNKFQCLHGLSYLTPERCSEIIVACCILFNLSKIFNERADVEDHIEVDRVEAQGYDMEM